MNIIKPVFGILIFIVIPFTVFAAGNCPVSDPNSYEDCVIEKVSTLISEKKYSYAIDLLSSYEEWYKAQKKVDSGAIARILSGKAAVFYLKGDYEESLKWFNEALRLYSLQKKADKIAETKTNISIVTASLYKYEDALRIISEAEKYYRDNKRKIDLADVLFNKGIFYYFSNDFENALKSFTEAENLYLENNLKIRYLSTQVLKGIIKAKSGDYENALYLCKDNMLSFSLKYYCIALANDGLGNKEEAKRAYQRAIEKIDRNINSAIDGSGDQSAQALSEKYASVFTDYLLFMLKSSIR